MTFVLGVVLFAVGIGISVALHEAGHMCTAKAFGMKVRRYFIGFGPTLFSFRRGETEYGFKVIPAGGFCDIAGMTALEDLPDPRDRKRAFFRFPTWKRVVVLSAGSVMHFVLGIALVYVMATSTGLPNVNRPPTPPVLAEISPCISANGPCAPGSPAPARDAGLKAGDRVLAVAGTPVGNRTELLTAIQSRSGPTEFLLERDGQQRTVTVNVARVPASALGGRGDQVVGAIGVSLQLPTVPATLRYGPLDAVGQTVAFTGMMFADTWAGLKQFPQKVPLLLDRIAGQDRQDTPVSVIGVSVLGGDALDLDAWWFFLFLLAAFNLFVGVLNLLPLLPMDGGHIAVNLYESARNAVRRAFGRPNGPPVDYNRLMPLTYVVVIVFIGVGALTIAADIINPIRLPRPQ